MAETTTYEEIELEINKESKIALIRLNRPKRMNAFTGKMMKELVDAFAKCDANDNDVNAIVLTGNGRAFCAGADLSHGESTFAYEGRSKERMSLEEQQENHRDSGGILSLAISNCRKPTIAAINGSAVGVGLTMTLPCDIRVCLEDAKVGFVFVRRGIAPEACSSYFLPKLVGINKALDLCLTGRVFSAKEEPSLFTYLEPTPEKVLQRAISIATEISKFTSPLSIAVTKKLLWNGVSNTGTPISAHRNESRAIFYMGRKSDAKEGITSFLEKRNPKFQSQISTDLPSFISKL